MPNSDRGADVVWVKALVLLYGPQGDWLTFDELLNKPHRVNEVKRITENGAELIYVHLTHDRARLEVWFDPQVNYLMRRLTTHTFRAGSSKARETKTESVVTRFRELAPAVFFPEQTEQRTPSENPSAGTAITVNDFHEMIVNQPVAAEVFKVRYPPGIEVRDSIQGRAYSVQRDGELKEIPGRTLSKIGPLPLITESQTTEEPRPATRWILPVSLAILGVAGIAWVWRRSRRGRLSA
jgi:hypothetical protein